MEFDHEYIYLYITRDEILWKEYRNVAQYFKENVRKHSAETAFTNNPVALNFCILKKMDVSIRNDLSSKSKSYQLSGFLNVFK